MTEELKIVENFLKNLKKTPSRTYTTQYIQEKLIYLDTLKTDFLAKQLDQTEIDKFHNIFKATTDILQDTNKLTTQNTYAQELKMSNFNIESANKIIPTFTGHFNELTSFLTCAQLINDTLTETGKSTLITFIYNVKLDNKVRTLLSAEPIPKNFEELKSMLTRNFKCKKTIPMLYTELGNLTQRNTVTSFRDKILELTALLNDIQITQRGEEQRNAIIQSNNEFALTIFKNGLSEKLKMVICAAQPTTFLQATQIALDFELSCNNQHNILPINNNNSNNSRNFNSNHRNNNYRNNNNQNSRYNNNFNRRNNNNTNNQDSRNNNCNNKNNSNRNYSYQNNGNYNNNNYNNRRQNQNRSSHNNQNNSNRNNNSQNHHNNNQNNTRYNVQHIEQENCRDQTEAPTSLAQH